ncbi:unnamed protein product [Blepharisma stoltei]|uniref:Uncharacterized protein n=1 Tax=Blepharisma stoltei TaxID=1481888 RepID=A0AAU9K648_9CILI|nr:unnamed protein product [Blepharisma stoltei]
MEENRSITFLSASSEADEEMPNFFSKEPKPLISTNVYVCSKSRSNIIMIDWTDNKINNSSRFEQRNSNFMALDPMNLMKRNENYSVKLRKDQRTDFFQKKRLRLDDRTEETEDENEINLIKKIKLISESNPIRKIKDRSDSNFIRNRKCSEDDEIESESELEIILSEK